jgi:glycosyltransferase involved in cell wall biosynthesis
MEGLKVPRVSVIMPCYNQGAYVDEAVDSILSQTFPDFEIIIVNDGSTDEHTNRKLESFDKPKSRVLRTTNQGLAAARNNGIRDAIGEYILPLDADDRIAPTYLEKAVRVLDENPNAGIVYCEAEFFGEESGKWPIPAYRFPEILLRNFIFCSAFFRKADWEQTSGYQPMFGWEDYDFWLSLIERGREVVRIPEVLFYYRRVQGSMIKMMTREQQLTAHTRIFSSHTALYTENIHFIFSEILRLSDLVAEMSLKQQEQLTLIEQLQTSVWSKLYGRCASLKQRILQVIGGGRPA